MPTCSPLSRPLRVSTPRPLALLLTLALVTFAGLSTAGPLAAQPDLPEPESPNPDAAKPAAPPPAAPVADLDAEQLEELLFLTDELSNPQWSARERASKAIVAMGPAVGPHLARMLGERRPAEQLWRMRNALVALGLAHLDPAALSLVLREHLEPLTQRLFVQWEVESELAPTLDSEEGMELFKQLLTIDKVQVGPMAALLKTDTREILRTNLAYLLGRIADPAHADALAHATRDTCPLVRVQAAHALGTMQATAHAGRLVEMLKDPDRTVQIAAAMSLIPMRSKATVGPMIDALSAGGHVGFAINWALERLTGQETSYNAFRPERRHAGAKQWEAWFAANKDRFELAAAEGGGPELAIHEEDENWANVRFARGVGGRAAFGVAKLGRDLRELRVLLEKVKRAR